MTYHTEIAVKLNRNRHLDFVWELVCLVGDISDLVSEPKTSKWEMLRHSINNSITSFQKHDKSWYQEYISLHQHMLLVYRFYMEHSRGAHGGGTVKLSQKQAKRLAMQVHDTFKKLPLPSTDSAITDSHIKERYRYSAIMLNLDDYEEAEQVKVLLKYLHSTIDAISTLNIKV